ncbi:MAG: glycosyltransferase family 2 protein [Acidobacteriota bacterium]|nr:glycosyltransferase family 2 protein [Acidobacteriota bacterium]
MIYIFYILSLILIFLSYKSRRGGISYLDFFKRELAKPKSDYVPFVSIIAPCRGVDTEMRENLSALFAQDFPKYEIIFAVDDAKDAAARIIETVSRQGVKGEQNVSPKLIVTGKAVDESQKVHNLREAVLHVAEDAKIFVFVDSDARPAENWLRDLIAPLRDEKIGAATGYRWFVSRHKNFASAMLAVWNASIASALGANTKSNFCWGGSMAIRRDTFEKLDISRRLKGAVSDDFTVTSIMKKAGLPIFFVPQALTASIQDCSLPQLFEFTTRQMKITRVYATNLWIASFLGSFLFNLVFVWGILILIFGAVNTLSFWVAFAVLITISILSIGKARHRLSAVKMVLKKHEKELDAQFWVQTIFWILTPALFLYNNFAAWFSRKIVWRGIKYQLNSPKQTSIIKEKERL